MANASAAKPCAEAPRARACGVSSPAAMVEGWTAMARLAPEGGLGWLLADPWALPPGGVQWMTMAMPVIVKRQWSF